MCLLLLLKEEEIVSQKREVILPESHCWQKQALNPGVLTPGLGLLLQHHSAAPQDCKLDLHHDLQVFTVSSLGFPAPFTSHTLTSATPARGLSHQAESPIVNHLLKEFYICCREIYRPQVTSHNFGHLGEIMMLQSSLSKCCRNLTPIKKPLNKSAQKRHPFLALLFRRSKF